MQNRVMVVLRGLRGPSIVSSPFAVVVGTVVSSNINFLVLALELIGVTLFQMSANLVNDYQDLRVENRKGLHNFVLPIREYQLLLRTAYVSMVVGSLLGALVISITGAYLLVIPLGIGLVMAYGYSGIPFNLSRFGEFVVPFSFFLISLAVFYSQALTITLNGILAPVAASLFVFLTYITHQFSDYQEDLRTGNPTLLLKVGVRISSIISYVALAVIIILMYLLGIYYTIVPMLALPYFLYMAHKNMDPISVRRAQVYILALEVFFIINAILIH